MENVQDYFYSPPSNFEENKEADEDLEAYEIEDSVK